MKPYSLMQKEIRKVWVIPFGFIFCFVFFLIGEVVMPLFFGKSGFKGSLDSVITYFSLAISISFSLGAFFLSTENETGNINFLLRLPLQKKQIIKEKILAHLIVFMISSFVIWVIILFFDQLGFRFYVSNESKTPLLLISLLIHIPFSYLIGATISAVFKNFFNVLFVGMVVYGVLFIFAINLDQQVFNLDDQRGLSTFLVILLILIGTGLFFTLKKLLELKESK